MSNFPNTTADALWAAFDRVRGVLPVDEMRNTLLGLLFLNWLWSPAGSKRFTIPPEARRERVFSQSPEEFAYALNRAAARIEQQNPRLQGLISEDFARLARDPNIVAHFQEVFERAQPADTAAYASLFSGLLQQFATREGARGGAYYSPESIRRLLVGLTRPERGLVYDPAAGVGGLLVEAATYARERGAIISVFGHELSPNTWRLGNINLLLNDVVDGQIERANTLELATLSLQADVVLAEPPFGQRRWRAHQKAVFTDPRWRYGDPPESDATFAWIQHALFCLRDGGRAAVVVPPSAAYAKHSSEIRRRMVAAGVIEAVIALPPGLFLSTQIPAQIWILRTEEEARSLQAAGDNILFIDARSSGIARRRSNAVELTDEELDGIASLYWQWRESPRPFITKTASAAPASAISHLPDASLDPEQYVGEEVVSSHRRPLISRLTLENFKSIGNRAEVELAPITLLYGPNSAGKTSVLQSLLLLKQSFAFAERAGGAPRLVTQGDLVDLGSYGALIHGHDEDRTLALGVEFTPLDRRGPVALAGPRYFELRFGRPASAAGPQQQTVTVGAEGMSFKFSIDRSAEPVDDSQQERQLFVSDSDPEEMLRFVERFGLRGAETRRASRADLPRTWQMGDTSAQRVRRDVEEFRLWLVGEKRSALLPPADGRLRFSGDFFPRTFEAEQADERRPRAGTGAGVAAGLLLADGLATPGTELQAVLGELSYLGPLREPPSRFHDLSSAAGAGIGSRGEHVASHLYWNETVLDEVNEWLEQLAVPYELRVIPVSSAEGVVAIGDVIAMVLRHRRSGFDVTPKDVGFGISQLLPIVVQLVNARHAVTLVEQPEIHVHPALQAKLGDLLIDATAEERGNQVIVETHSEHLMLRLQRRIRLGQLDPDRVSVIYVDSDEDGAAVISQLRLADDGEFIDPWPNGFFAERLEEVFGGDDT